jgi:hypothetical protein
MGIKGALKKSASGVPCLRRASFAEVATEAESATRLRAEALQRASAQAGRPFVVLTYLSVRSVRQTTVTPFGIRQTMTALLDGPF